MNGIPLNPASGIDIFERFSHVPEEELYHFGRLAEPFIVENTVLENNAALVLSPKLEIKDMDPALTPMSCGYYFFINHNNFPDKTNFRTVFDLIWRHHENEMTTDPSTLSPFNTDEIFEEFRKRE